MKSWLWFTSLFVSVSTFAILPETIRLKWTPAPYWFEYYQLVRVTDTGRVTYAVQPSNEFVFGDSSVTTNAIFNPEPLQYYATNETAFVGCMEVIAATNVHNSFTLELFGVKGIGSQPEFLTAITYPFVVLNVTTGNWFLMRSAILANWEVLRPVTGPTKVGIVVNPTPKKHLNGKPKEFFKFDYETNTISGVMEMESEPPLEMMFMRQSLERESEELPSYILPWN